MSKWLQNVGQFLEKLDDQAEKVVEENPQLLRNLGAKQQQKGDILYQQEQQIEEDFLEQDIASIVAARGLQEGAEPEVNAEDAADDGHHGDDVGTEEVGSNTNDPQKLTTEREVDNKAESIRTGDSDGNAIEIKTDGKNQPIVDFKSSLEDNEVTVSPEKQLLPYVGNEVEENLSIEKGEAPEGPLVARGSEDGNNDESSISKPDIDGGLGRGAKTIQASSSDSPSPSSRVNGDSEHVDSQLSSQNQQEMAKLQDQLKQQQSQYQQLQKESLTLKRHVVSINKQLEQAEAEINAQRDELERAGDRMQRDSARFKEERENEKKRHAEEINSLKAQHEQATKDIKQRANLQLEEVRSQLKNVEQRRMQEGGDWTKELEDAVNREQDAIAKLAAVEDEKATLLSQISTLQAQQEALGSRLESLTQTADSAFEREREAENRLDEVLSTHARQITQRQAREAELERTVAELGAALVVARDAATANGADDHDFSGHGSSSRLNASSSDMRITSLESELESLRTQLNDEQQRNESLQRELREVTNERTEESTVAHTRQSMYDRQISELSSSVTRLKNELRESKRDSLREKATRDRHGDDEEAQQIKRLSEDVLRLREKVSNSNSELAALKSRLQAALNRAQKAETALEEKMETASYDTGDDLEVANGSPIGSGMRRRVGRRVKGRGPSIRKALHLDAVQTGQSERIGKSLDALDAFLTESGKFLRYNPLARLLFIVYLLLLHLWTFVLLFVHTHSFGTIHGDFGSVGNLPHGPGALMQQQMPQLQQVQGSTAISPGNGGR